MSKGGFEFPADCMSLKCMIGVYGVITSRLRTAHDVIETVNILYDLDVPFGWSDEEDHAMILLQQKTLHDLGNRVRRHLFVKNFEKVPKELISLKPQNQARIDRERQSEWMF